MNAVEQRVIRQMETIRAGTAEIISEDELSTKIYSSIEDGRPLRVKFGIDPTDPNVHIGHMVPCRKLREFQDLGHTAVLIIGDYTAQIGDSTGRDAERPPLSREDVAHNMITYEKQLFKILDPARTEVHYQSSWFDTMGVGDFIRFCSSFSVAQLLAHDTFRRRIDAGNRLSVHELTYPVVQAIDSVQIDADIEIGGADQKFNCLCGRDLQRASGRLPQVVITLPLLLGPDGEKMSKSRGNHIPVQSDAREKIGKVMSIPDALLAEYTGLASSWDRAAQAALLDGLAAGSIHPRDLKMRLAKNIASQYHDTGDVEEASAEFDRVFGGRQVPEDMPLFRFSGNRTLEWVLKEARLVSSGSEARRLVASGAVKIDGRKVLQFDHKMSGNRDAVVQVGKRRFVRVCAN